tara:strand:- start:96 stop:314 length:219 start_codon:yes stop_codon:yes gene_type:complete
MAKSGASKGAKKINAFNDGKLDGVNIASGAPYTVTNADKVGNTPAYQGYKAGKKNKKTGEPLYKAAPHLKGV